MKPNKRIFLQAFLIALGLTLLTAFSVTSAVRRAAEAVLSHITDQSLWEALSPLRFIRFRVSVLPTAVGALIVSLPVWRILADRRTAVRILWSLLVLVLLSVIWLISLFTLSVSPVSLFRMFFLLSGI